MHPNDPKTYLDDTLHTFQEDLAIINKPMTIFKEAEMQVNAVKCFFCMIELEFVGYLLTQTCYMPLSKLIKAILEMALPKNVTKIHAFNAQSISS